MISVAAAITVAVKPASASAPAVAITAKNGRENKRHTETDQHCFRVISSRHVKVKENVHALPSQKTEALL